MTSKDCFVIMPIRSEGSQEHSHFRTLYDEWLKPVIVDRGFEPDRVVRADDIQKVGAITQDIVLRLAQADVVVADLTDLNPNVFYELGVRHTLRGRGTIMIVDEERTPAIPFDLLAYRVLRFRSDMGGIAKLRKELGKFIDKFLADESDHRDNPVHNWLPMLPVDAVAASAGSEEGKLRQQVSSLKKRLREYQEAYGLADNPLGHSDGPSTSITSLLEQAKEGTLGPDLVRRAHQAVGEQDKVKYLEALHRISQDPNLRLEANDYRRLAGDASALGLSPAVAAVFDLAMKVHPNDRSLRNTQLAHFAHSSDPAERSKAREQLLAETGIRIDNEDVELPQQVNAESASLVGLMLDAFHEDGLDAGALRITTALTGRWPHVSVFARNHARALKRSGDDDAALEWYRRAIWCRDARDTSALWLGNELFNRGRKIDALESYALASKMDPDDANNFAHVADAISSSIEDDDGTDHAWETDGTDHAGETVRTLPERIVLDTFQDVLVAAFSCELIAETDVTCCIEAASRTGIDQETLHLISRVRTGEQMSLDGKPLARMRLAERKKLAGQVYEAVKSPLTIPPAKS